MPSLGNSVNFQYPEISIELVKILIEGQTREYIKQAIKLLFPDCVITESVESDPKEKIFSRAATSFVLPDLHKVRLKDFVENTAHELAATHLKVIKNEEKPRVIDIDIQSILIHRTLRQIAQYRIGK